MCNKNIEAGYRGGGGGDVDLESSPPFPIKSRLNQVWPVK